MGFLGRLLLGKGTLSPKVKAELEAEGLVLLEEGVPGRIRYSHFKAPGKRFHGKVTPERLAIALSEERFVVYCRSGRAELMDSPYSSPRLAALDASLDGADTVKLRVDYDRMGEPSVSGVITISAKTPRAAEIVEQLNARIGRQSPVAD